MTTNCFNVGGNTSGQTFFSGSVYNAFGGGLNQGATESHQQRKVGKAVTLKDLVGVVAGFAGSGSGSISVRQNGSTVNNTISWSTITSATLFKDTTHSDSIAVNDLVNTIATRTAGNPVFYGMGINISATSPVQFLGYFNGGTSSTTGDGATFSVSSTSATFIALSGTATGTPTTTDNVGLRGTLRGGASLEYMQGYITANATGSTSTITQRHNGTNGNGTLSISAAATGLTVDTTHTDTFTAGDNGNYQIVLGSANSVSWSFLGVEQAISGSKHDLLTADTAENHTQFLSTTFSNIGGNAPGNATEANMQISAHQTSFTASNLRAVGDTLSGTKNVTFRVGGVDGNQTLALTTSNTLTEDSTHTDSVSADTLMDIHWVVTSGAGDYNWGGVTLDDGSGGGGGGGTGNSTVVVMT